MKNFAWLGMIALSMTQGCIYYEGTGAEWDDDCEMGCWDWDGDGDVDPDATNPDTDAPADDEPDAGPALVFWPDHAAQGDTFIATITGDGSFDLSGAQDIHAFGDVDILTSDPRGSEIVVAVGVWDDAELGTVDLLVEFADQVVFLEDALTLHPTGTDTDALCSDPPASQDDGGTDGSGTDGSGTDGSGTDGSGSGTDGSADGSDDDCP